MVSAEMAASTSISPPHNPFGVHIKDLVPVTLDQTNYMKWSHLFLPVLEIYDLHPHLDTSIPIPSTTIPDSSDKLVPNPAYNHWRHLDRLILTWINATIATDLLPLLYDASFAAEAWNTLKSHFLQQTTARELQLKLQLQTLKKGDLSIDKFMTKIQETSDSLTAIGRSISDPELVLSVLQGLPPSYEAFITMASNQKPPPTFKELWTMLLTQESRIEQLHGVPVSSSSSTAFVATKDYLPSSRGGRSARGRGFGGRWQNHGRGGRGRAGWHPFGRGNGSFMLPCSPASRGILGSAPYPPFVSQQSNQPSFASPNPALPNVKCQICNNSGHVALICPDRLNMPMLPLILAAPLRAFLSMILVIKLGTWIVVLAPI
ncbi:OLC1v1036669C1 [Oldenlandia corymbosa var. corymbosa]|uniref:OLC1v1036669C1 n=1 Tax=Oldenlandia corymbosa var. corymbosa TaxID=529605 RepID=A0AAV1CVW4_OLDCO|nr:OLC1v1036669C1 [Oldenlandia corymbosa var. corymbosa]